MGLNLDSLKFDPSDAGEGPNVGAYLRSSDGTLLTHTSLVGGEEALDVNLAGGTGFGIYAEDSLHVDQDLGQQIFAVRNDTEGSLVDTDGDYAPFQVDNLGRLRVVADIDVVNTSPNSAQNCATIALAVAATAIQLDAAALAGRKTLLIQNSGSKSVYLGCDNTVTAANGIEVVRDGSIEFEMGDALTIWAISSSASQEVRLMELA